MEQFCLKWNNFQTSIISAFESLQNSEDLVDVTLTCEGFSMKAHKIILSACSPYFRTVFKENPCSHPIIILKDVHYIDLVAILNFMYHGEVLVSQHQLQSFLQTAELLQVSGLIGSSENKNKYMSNLGSSTLTKSNKKIRRSRSPERTSKKSKILPKTKSVSKSSPCSKSNDQLEKIEDSEHSGAVARFEVIQTTLVKSETEDETKNEARDCNENIESHDIIHNTDPQGSILEAALENKDSHSSILERSLTSQTAAKSCTSFSSESQTVPKKTSEVSEIDYLTLKHNVESPLVATAKAYDLIIENIPKSIKGECEGRMSIEQSPENSQNAFELTCAKSLSETIHHSSQCGNCPHCGKVYSNQSALKYHVRLIHSDLTNMYCCHLCPESFDYREGYKKHMVEVHSIRN